jgi:Fe-S oxidoreductase
VAVGKERVEEAVSSGTDVLVTACSVCIESFTEAKQAGSFNTEIKELSVLLLDSLVK